MEGSYERLDKLLVVRGLVASRQRAQALIMAGKVIVNSRMLTKAGQRVPKDCEIRIIGKQLPYVSRGGLKLEHALKTFGIDASGLNALDVGAATGGFTDCLLQHGAKRVFAVDVGYGQLAWKLRNDNRVTVIEKQNIRYITPDKIPVPVQIATIDVSFISLKLVIPAILPLLDHPATVISLIKPQFEAGRAHIEKGGVVRSPEIRAKVCNEIIRFCVELGLRPIGLTPSPVLGPKGNQEFLFASIWN